MVENIVSVTTEIVNLWHRLSMLQGTVTEDWGRQETHIFSLSICGSSLLGTIAHMEEL